MRKPNPVRLVIVLVPALAFAMAIDLIMFALNVPPLERWLILALVFAFAFRAGWVLTEFNGRG